jgi:hypothetical protein
MAISFPSDRTSTAALQSSHSSTPQPASVRHEPSHRSVVHNPWSIKRGLMLGLAAYAALAGAARPAHAAEPVIRHVKFTELATLRPEYRGEDGPWGVKYLDETGRKKYEIEVRDSKLYQADGKPLDSGDGASCAVIDAASRRIYAKDECDPGRFQHSSFLAGGDVGYAGDVFVEDGSLLYMDKRSGHYHSTSAQLDTAAAHMKSLGVDGFVVDHDNNFRQFYADKLRRDREEL